VRCRCCEDICPSNALTLYDEVLAEDLLSGGVEHNVMHPPKYDMSSSKRTRTMLRDILGCEDIFDR
jgi:ferredoxin